MGDEGTGKSLVLDARRDVDVYFEAARARGLRITHAIDSHGHNDYVSGISEMRSRQDVDALAYADAGVGYEHTPMRDGEIVELGDVGIEVSHTPGHTPEHVSLVVYDRSVGDEPALLLSGGALLVGDLARPDLLGGEEQAREMARVFCHTLQEKILFTLPDHLEVFPTHVAGSLAATSAAGCPRPSAMSAERTLSSRACRLPRSSWTNASGSTTSPRCRPTGSA